MPAGLERMVMEGRTGDDETTGNLKQKKVFYREEGEALQPPSLNASIGDPAFFNVRLDSRSESMRE
jgi:hypothetical protein